MTTYPANGSSYFAITIGINQYQSFQALNYAQHDAQALHEFLVQEAGFPVENCLLLTDSSADVQGRATLPTQESIQTWVTEWCQQRVTPGDLLWIFFCGYGVCFQGQDYLMPIDSSLADIPGTGIALNWLYGLLKATVGETALVILDMNRSAGIQSRGLLGTETTQLAQSTEIATLLSCRPNEFSHESPTLRQGFFTSVLLEGLRYYDCTSLERLSTYLNHRLPQLKEHHHQPRQHPVAVGMAAAILPLQSNNGVGVTPLNGHFATPFNRSQVTQLGNGTAAVSVLDTAATVPATPSPGDGGIPAGIYTSLLNQLVGNPKFSQPPATDTTLDPGHSVNRGADFPDSGGVVPQKEHSVRGPAMESSEGQASANATPEPEEIELEDSTFWRRVLLWGGAIATILLLGTLLRNGAVFWGKPAAKSPAPGAVSAPLPAQAPSLITPQTQPTTSGRSVTATSPSSPPLTQAKKILTANQASRFSDAIRAARRISPNDPLYPQARQDIERWSRVILDLAEGRAASGQYAEAIAAAKLVPQDVAAAAPARQAIAAWQAQLTPRRPAPTPSADPLNQAISMVRVNSASSFSDAIGLARQVRVGDPQYSQAQQLIAEWSQMILMIAKSRAEKGKNLPQAIKAAKLVPSGTAAYGEAQQMIQTWERLLQRS